jgi:hypothetical protein
MLKMQTRRLFIFANYHKLRLGVTNNEAFRMSVMMGVNMCEPFNVSPSHLTLKCPAVNIRTTCFNVLELCIMCREFVYIVTNVTFARQRFGKNIPEVT